MKNELKKLLIVFIILALYYFISKIFEIYIPCIFRSITHLYCPGCGSTRMFLALLDFNFYQAFRYNMLLFILLPFFIILVLNYVYALIYNKEAWFKKIPNIVWYILIVLLILFSIVRNIFPYFAPTTI